MLFRIMDDLSSVALDPTQGEAHALNPVATAILERCDGTLTAAEIATELGEIFDADPEQIRADVLVFLESLRQRGLVEWE